MPRIEEVTIASGSSTSSSAEYQSGSRDWQASAVIFEGTYTNTSFDLQVQVGDSWYDVYDVFESKINIGTSSDGKFSLPIDSFKDVDKIRLNSPDDTNEAADRTAKFLFIQI